MRGLGHSSWQTFRGTFHRLATLKAEGLDSFRPDMIRIPVTDGVLQSELRFLMIELRRHLIVSKRGGRWITKIQIDRTAASFPPDNVVEYDRGVTVT